MQAYREQPWLRAVVGRIGQGVASARWRLYVRSEAPTRQRSAPRQRRGPAGQFGDVQGVPAFRWGRDRSVVDVELRSSDPLTRAARRRELAAQGLLREVTDHPLLELLAAPNTEMTGAVARRVTQIWLDIKGEAFWLLERGANGVPKAIWPIPPHWVSQVPTKENARFVLSFGGLQMQVAKESVIWLRDVDPENPYGRGAGTAEALGDELETDEYAAKYLKNWFFNSAIPSFLVSFEGATKDQLVDVRERWMREHQGYQNAHAPHFSNGKMNALRLDSSLRDQQIADLRKLSRDTVAQVFSMPPEVLGIIENSNRATAQASRFIYVVGVELPRVEFLREELQHQFAPIFDPALCLEAEISVPDDDERRLNVLKAMPGAFSLNEWRGEAGYDPEPDFEGVFPPLALPGQQPGTSPAATPSETTPKSPPEEEPETSDDLEEDDGVSKENELPDDADRADPPWAKAPIR